MKNEFRGKKLRYKPGLFVAQPSPKLTTPVKKARLLSPSPSLDWKWIKLLMHEIPTFVPSVTLKVKYPYEFVDKTGNRIREHNSRNYVPDWDRTWGSFDYDQEYQAQMRVDSITSLPCTQKKKYRFPSYCWFNYRLLSLRTFLYHLYHWSDIDIFILNIFL